MIQPNCSPQTWYNLHFTLIIFYPDLYLHIISFLRDLRDLRDRNNNSDNVVSTTLYSPSPLSTWSSPDNLSSYSSVKVSQHLPDTGGFTVVAWVLVLATLAPDSFLDLTSQDTMLVSLLLCPSSSATSRDCDCCLTMAALSLSLSLSSCRATERTFSLCHSLLYKSNTRLLKVKIQKRMKPCRLSVTTKQSMITWK